MYKIKPHNGFTLLELIIVLAIAAILVGIAVPSFDGYIKKNAVQALEHELNTSIILARGEALSRQKPITITRTTSSGLSTGNWSEGWIVFIDVDADGLLDSGEETLFSKTNNGKASVRASNPDKSTNAAINFVTFNYKGYSNDDSRASFTVCPQTKELSYSRGLILERSGRLMRSKDTTGDGVHEVILLDDSGNVQKTPLSCP